MTENKNLAEKISEIRNVIQIIQKLIEICKKNNDDSNSDLRKLYELQQEYYGELRVLFVAAVGDKNRLMERFDESLFRYELTWNLHLNTILPTST
ncbi:hypothetical protein G7092_02710 [Mucilaginibacter sp. HC2]|uniref:hypothetical protein n=1 Tax=Mucilaginibacter inviolabilis TaxID=2714892 RepID=UPI0014075240|nr:hypothetical protein [Mucilaginibacter inviolabilis]NHA02688.1 hypothetical protein [Mucilaginibacter inviolabilis]